MISDKYKIRKIVAREVLDSRGNPTVEAEVHTASHLATAIAPSGASKGKHEALELRDGEKRYLGQGVQKAVRNIDKIIYPKLRGKDVRDQELLDLSMIRLDGTPNKSRLGANAMLAVSLACARTAAYALNVPLFQYLRRYALRKEYLLPVPFLNVINGGLHADNGLSFQEYMIVPFCKTFRDSLRVASETYHVLKSIIHQRYGKGSTAVGDEGGFAPKFKNEEEPLQLLVQAIKKAGHVGRIKLALDCAATDCYKNERYYVNKRWHTPEKLLDFYEYLLKRYPIISIEDPFNEEDWLHFSILTRRHGNSVLVVGDDLLVTNAERIRYAIDYRACNTLLLKVNQIGTLTEAAKSAQIAHNSAWGVMVSHRSGETEDPFMADFAVGLSSGMIKDGAPCRGERTAKHNQLLRIEETLGKRAAYAGRHGLRCV